MASTASHPLPANPMLAAPAPRLTLDDLWRSVGGVPLRRVLATPPPGLAGEADVLALAGAADKRLCELVEGVLVEKAMGFEESALAIWLAALLANHVRAKNLGVVTGADGMVALWPGRVRVPDVAFYSWDRLPGRRRPTAPLPQVAPDLAVEILSASNTPQEMRLKREDYFRAGTRLVWEIDPAARSAAVFTSPDAGQFFTVAEDLSGGAVLPDFVVALAEVFAELDRQG